MAHTPGPWTVICDRDDDDERPLEIVVANDWNHRIAFPASDGNPDDARLIAAAPNLLVAVKAAHHALISYQNWNASTELAEEIAAVCAAAIATAEAG
jgi:hypothetical protein